ncbi:MAG: GNAT family N-acetyltransferase [Bdellovibrionaceae bacterium]|nr:GNAT family N-acetyltransferase [Pseudobdellovibrionaceae bacterium]
MTLTPMTELEFKIWEPRSRAAYAADKARSNSMTLIEAQEAADRDFRRYLPDGLKTEQSHLFTAKNGAGEILGFIWFAIRDTPSKRSAFIYDVVIESEHRGQGHGREMMKLAELEIRKLGATRIGLHVFGYNTVAVQLYHSLGYLTTDVDMEKVLQP